jgi:hypothetical protein
MAVRDDRKSDRATAAPGRKGGKKSGPSRADATLDTSDEAVLALLQRIKEAHDQNEIRQLSDQLERVIFHRQYANS